MLYIITFKQMLTHVYLNILNHHFLIQAVNKPVDVPNIETECKSPVVQVFRCRCVNHTKHRVAASTDQIHNQTA